VIPGGRSMRLDRQGTAFTCAALVAATMALTACVPGAYVYDNPPAVHYRSVGSPYPPAHYYGYPSNYDYAGYPGYYATPGHYGDMPYPPRMVHFDHDHRGDDCRDPSHRDGRRGGDRDRNDRNGRDRSPQGRDGRPDRRPSGEAPATPSPQWRDPPRGASPEGPGAPPQSRGMRARRVPEVREPRKPPEERKELD